MTRNLREKRDVPKQSERRDENAPPTNVSVTMSGKFCQTKDAQNRNKTAIRDMAYERCKSTISNSAFFHEARNERLLSSSSCWARISGTVIQCHDSTSCALARMRSVSESSACHQRR